MLKVRCRPGYGVITALAIAIAVAASRSPRAEGPDVEVAAIRAMLDKQEADWNKGDLEGFVGGYWRSPKLVFMSGGNRHDGFEAMRDRYIKRYKSDGKAMGKLAFTGLEIQTLGPDSAFARGRWGLTMPDGKTPGGLYTLILRKFADGWKIVHDHTSIGEDPAIPPAPPAPPTPARPR